MPDRILVLDDADCAAILAARSAERTKQIEHNVAQRRLARLTAKTPAPVAATLTAARRKVTDAQAAADARTAARLAAHAAAKARHAVHDAYAAEHYDPAQGQLVCYVTPPAAVAGRPPVERTRKPMRDADADDYAASYALSCQATDAATDLMRRLAAYRAAHPALFAGSPGEPPPVDPAYEALKADLAAAQATAQAELAKQGAIVGRYVEPGYTYTRVEIATGDVVLGDKE